MPVMLDKSAEEEYPALVRVFPLLSIRDDARLAEALTVIEGLMDKAERSAAEEAFLEALTDLAETYEAAHVAIPPTSGREALH